MAPVVGVHVVEVILELEIAVVAVNVPVGITSLLAALGLAVTAC